MKKILIASLALAIAGCGPSEQEIQARIDKEVAQKVETLKAEMKAERAAEKAAELEAAAAAEAKRKAVSAEALPAVKLNADYGAIGTSVTGSALANPLRASTKAWIPAEIKAAFE